MDNSKSYEDANQGRQTRTLSSRKQGSARRPKTSTPTMSPPSYTFQVSGSAQQPDSHHAQEADRTQVTPYGGTSMDFRSTYGATRAGPSQAYIGAPVSDSSFFSPPPPQGIQSLGYASHTLSPPSLEYGSQALNYSGPQYTQASLPPNSFWPISSGNPNGSMHNLTSRTDQHSQHPFRNLGSDVLNGQPHCPPSPDPTYPSHDTSDQGYTQSPFDNVDYSGRDMLLSDNFNENEQNSGPQNRYIPDNSPAVSPPTAPQPRPQTISARNPTPPPGYMFSSPADLQAAVENDPQRVYNYIRKLNRENIRLQETLGKSKQQTKDEEDRDKRHVAVLERAWANLSAALVQVNPALANASGPATRASSGAQVAQAGGPNQAGVPPPARGRGTGRGGSAGLGGGLRLDDAAGQELPAGPRRSTRRNTRSDKAAGNTRIGNKAAAGNDDEENDDL